MWNDPHARLQTIQPKEHMNNICIIVLICSTKCSIDWGKNLTYIIGLFSSSFWLIRLSFCTTTAWFMMFLKIVSKTVTCWLFNPQYVLYISYDKKMHLCFYIKSFGYFLHMFSVILCGVYADRLDIQLFMHWMTYPTFH